MIKHFRGGLCIKKKIIFSSVGLIISIFLLFGYHHFLTFLTYSADKMLEVEEKYSYRIDEIALFPYQLKDQYERQDRWYYSVEWLPLKWKINISKIHHFFSFPFDKSRSEIVLKGELSGERPDLDHIFITVNNKKVEPTGYTMTNLIGDSMRFTITVQTDDNLKTLQSLRLHVEDTEIKWSDLDEVKEMHYFFSPFYSQHNYIRE